MEKRIKQTRELAASKSGTGQSRKIVCPPDKSITHRAIMLGGFFGGCKIKNPLLSDDCLQTINCLTRLNGSVEYCGDYIKICGIHGQNSDFFAELYTGNSGTTTRLIMGLLSGTKGKYTLSGDQSLNSRPMRRVITPLEKMGARILSDNGKAPIIIEGQSLSGIEYSTPVPSAQVKSAILLGGTLAKGATIVTESCISRNHTEKMLKAFGANISSRAIGLKNEVTLLPSPLKAVDVEVVGDISSASYPLVYSLLSGEDISVLNVGINETRSGILDVFRQMGATVELSNIKNDDDALEKSADIRVFKNGDLKPFKIGADILPRLIDEIPVLCVLALMAKGDSLIENAEELKVKESNRQKTTVDMINALGGNAEETENGIVVHGCDKTISGGVVETHFDHRIALSGAVASAICRGDVVIKDAECVSVSFPNFFEIMKL